MLLRLVVGMAVVVCSFSLVFARQGTVVTKDGKTYQGDITDRGDTIEITGVAGISGPVGIQKSNVQSTVYPDELSAEVRAALKKLDRSNVKARVELAKVAMQQGAYDAARDALAEALVVEPNNEEAATLMLDVKRHLPAVATTAPASQPAATQAAVPPANPNPPAVPGEGAFIVKRPITNAEINRIRQLDLSDDDAGKVRVQIDAGTKRRFLAGYTDVTLAQFNQLSMDQQALLILTKGKPDMAKGVQIVTDTSSVSEFKKSVSHVVLQSCGSVACHGGNKAGSFTLVNSTSLPAIYTNYLVLQKYAVAKKDAQERRLLVDRAQPESSLLLEYMLPADVAGTPHPNLPSFRAAVRTKTDPRYVQVLHWISGLNALMPRYDIDLSKEPPTDPDKPEKPK